MTRAPRRSPDQENRGSKNFLQYTNIAAQMIIIILIGVFGGIKLDSWLEMEQPLFTLGCTIFAVIAAMYIIIKEALQK